MLAKHKRGINLLKFILAGFILWILIKSSQLNLHLFTNITQHTGLFISFLAMTFLIVFITAWRWNLLGEQQHVSLGLKQSLKPAYIGGAFNTLLPGSVGGDFIRCLYVSKKIPERKYTIFLTAFFDKLIGLMGILTTLCVAGLMRMTYITSQPTLFYLLLTMFAACSGLILVIVTLMLMPKRLNLSARVKQHFPHSLVATRIASYLEIFQQYRIPLKILAKTVLVSMVVEYLIATCLLIIAQMMGMPALDFSQVVLALGMTLLVSVIPVTPGGIGVGEMAFANILLLFNPGSPIAYATIFLGYRLLSMLAYLPAVLFYLPTLHRQDSFIETADS